jgi:predicted adenine nucleotide alpha hydrolase (AANH) superfamily ATPase
MSEKAPLLLHTCCAPCATASIERLRLLGYEPHLFYSNSNIWPEEEFEKRLEETRKLADITHTGLLIDPYDHDAWKGWISGLEEEPEHGKRCSRCFAFSLKRTAEEAYRQGIHLITTTLTISPHKNSKQVFAEGSNIDIEPPEGYDDSIGTVRFLEIDFKKQGGYSRSLHLTREYWFYRQSYCGCEFSFR